MYPRETNMPQERLLRAAVAAQQKVNEMRNREEREAVRARQDALAAGVMRSRVSRATCANE
jgi:hypothetical protein